MRINMPIFQVLLIIKYGLLCLAQRKTLQIASSYMLGNVIFTWTPSNHSFYDVLITTDTTSGDWKKNPSAQYTVKDALQYDSISINVRAPPSFESNIMTYYVYKAKAQVGSTVNVSWTAPFFPLAGQYNVYHTYRENRTIFRISRSGVSYGGNTQSAKYSYLTRPIDRLNIMFDIRDITLDDAGYYNGGVSKEAAWAAGGVVLIVSGRPSTPNIIGDLDVQVNDITTLTCSSNSTSAPDYYSKLVTLSYTWYVNDKKKIGDTKKSLRVYGTRNLKYEKYSCTATEEDMESDRGVPVQMNPLYLDIPTIYINDVSSSYVEASENTSLRISCHVDGNPAPTIRLSRVQVDTGLVERQGKWLNYTIDTVQCTDTDTYSCKGTSTGFNNTEKVFKINVLCNASFDSGGNFKSTYGSKSGLDTTVNVAVPIISNPPPQASDFTWVGPLHVPVSARTTICIGDVAYRHVIRSTLPVKDRNFFGSYTLSYNGEIITKITIKPEDDEALRSHIVAISLLSLLLGLTWLIVALIVIYKRRYHSVHQNSKHGKESIHLEEAPTMTQQYVDVIDMVVDQLEAQNMSQDYDDVPDTVAEGNYMDTNGNNTDVERNYTELSQPDTVAPHGIL